MKQLLLEAFMPVIASVLSIFVPALMTLAFARFQAWSGMQIEALQREALQSALGNAARIMMAGATQKAGIDYVLASVPDALKGLKVESRDRIAELLAPHIAGSKAATNRAAMVANAASRIYGIDPGKAAAEADPE